MYGGVSIKRSCCNSNHSINIINGANRLASGVVAIFCVAIGMMAYQAGDDSFAEISFIIAAVMIGFFLLNYPLGKVFLGDGGATCWDLYWHALQFYCHSEILVFHFGGL